MAEIFILVVFMLLLMLLALYADNDRCERECKERIDECENGPLPEGVIPVGESEDQCEKKTADLRARVTALEEENAGLRDRVATLEEENAGLRDRVTALEKENAVLRNRVADLEAENFRLHKQIADLRNRVADLEAENRQLRKQISKGINPPCWYQVVDRQGKRHEKPYYLMSIAVYDDHLRVILRPESPPGSATYESGESAPTSYQQEYERVLALAPFQAAGDMSLAVFADNAKPIWRMGKNKEIRRDYPCVFYAAVWDMTGPTKKERWKHARATIEIYFPAYVVQDDPWPGDVGN